MVALFQPLVVQQTLAVGSVEANQAFAASADARCQQQLHGADEGPLGLTPDVMAFGQVSGVIHGLLPDMVVSKLLEPGTLSVP